VTLFFERYDENGDAVMPVVKAKAACPPKNVRRHDGLDQARTGLVLMKLIRPVREGVSKGEIWLVGKSV
jgi:hypothetical protein